MSALLMIDSGLPTMATLDAPPSLQYDILHVMLFNMQGFLLQSHSAMITVLDWNSGFSEMMLDYINMNKTEGVVITNSFSVTAADPLVASVLVAAVLSKEVGCPFWCLR